MNYKTILRTTAFILVTAVYAALITACGGDTYSDNNGNTAAAARTEDTTAEDNVYRADYLPNADYEGCKYRIVAYDEYPADFEEATGNLINDAIYTRNRMIEERYNIDIVETSYPYAKYSDVNTLMTNAALAQSDDYDLYTLVIRNAYNGVLQGYAPAASYLPIADLTQPWYLTVLNDNLTINGVTLLAYTSFDKNPGGYCIIFNKRVLEEINLAEPYQAVDDGTWTYDVLYGMAVKAIADLDGDGSMTETDRFSFISEWDNMTDLAYRGSGYTLVDFTKDPPELSMDEQLFDMFNLFAEYSKNDGFMFNTFKAYGASEDSRIKGNKLFASGGSMFMVRGTNTLTTLGDMEDDYGITPFPKWTEQQEHYYSGIDGSRIAIPLYCSGDLEKVCVIKEALAVESLNINHPVYYETALKYRYVRDEDSIRVLEIITNSNNIDIGCSFWYDIVREPWQTCLESGNANFSSAVEKNISKAQQAIDELIDTIDTLKSNGK